jgi:hypothetical protein
MTEIVQWQTIKGRFDDGLLLGNGASRNVHPGFDYVSLHEKAVELGYVNDAVRNVFDGFGTTDFELVLRRLWQAKLVNEALAIPHGKVESAYADVRTALIETVRATHVSHTEAKPHLELIYPFLQQFKIVVSLNYDLIVYWAAMLGNDALGTWFKDAFNGGCFRDNWAEVRAPLLPANGSTLYFYAHGNLVLEQEKAGGERKIPGNGTGLLEAILARWNSGSSVPLFVCEGASEHKMRAIASSSYLQRVFREVIPSVSESWVIYGWSMREQDQHIVKQLISPSVERIAVSVFKKNQDFVRHAKGVLESRGFNKEIVFFDSASTGCWNNPFNLNWG